MDSVTKKTGVLVLHWGKSGAGPRLMNSLAAELATFEDLRVHISYASGSEGASALENLGLPSTKVRTYSSKSGLVLGLPRMFILAMQLRSRIARDQIAVVVSPMTSIWQALALRIIMSRNVRYISSIHDASPHPGEGHWLANFCRSLELKRADLLVVFSRAVEDQLAKIVTDGTPILRTVHPVFSTAASPPNSTRELLLGSLDSAEAVLQGEKTWTIGFFGRIIRYKGIDVFVKSIQILRDRGYLVHGVVWGDGEVSKDTRGVAGGMVSWNIGWIPEDRVNPIVSTFDLLALPYIEASQSGVFAIAMAEGVPSVATPVGGLKEQIEETRAGILSADISADTFADAIARLIDDKDLFQECRRAAQAAAASTHSWHRVGEDFHAAVARACSGPGPGAGPGRVASSID